MADSESFPPIEPTNFDLIVVGTGLPESIIAAAASTAGKTVLHLDPHPFYGSHYSSLTLQDLTSFLHAQSKNPKTNSDQSDTSDHTSDHNATLDVTTRPLYSDIEISSYDDSIEEHSRKFNLDLAGPRVLFCADLAVNLLLKSTANQYVEFKNIDASYVGDANGNLMNVPDSKSAVFKDKTLKYSEKNQLNSFFKLVQGHLEAVKSVGVGVDVDDGKIISDEDLESPFVVFLDKMKLPPKIKSIILYAIVMVDYDQDGGESCKDILRTRDGIDRLALYHSSVGRFPNALGALIYPIYGQGELPQAFCRRAAVKGCLYVLRMPVVSVLLNKDGGSYRGVKLVSGQELTSHQLVMDPSITIASPLVNSSSESPKDVSNVFDLRDVSGKLARGICIAKSSLKPDVSNCLVIYPPRSLYPDQATSIRVLQLGSNLAVCPSGMFVFYVSVVCDDALEGKKSLHAAIDGLFSIHSSGATDTSSTVQTDTTEAKPSLLWSALFIQDLIEGSMGPVVTTPTPDGNLNYNDVLGATSKVFSVSNQSMFHFQKLEN
ncbi:rab escort protein 1 [Cynara cardunculus var. scolymus]|uniref:rab escort protein 1 n=1 Tax=Cynara cardunculus var. scolymus TaxID=59895 RepID=UPI000D62BDA2|nr:rab escort protein 1 [Cynara cardunculus var. scolymus]